MLSKPRARTCPPYNCPIQKAGAIVRKLLSQLFDTARNERTSDVHLAIPSRLNARSYKSHTAERHVRRLGKRVRRERASCHAECRRNLQAALTGSGAGARSYPSDLQGCGAYLCSVPSSRRMLLDHDTGGHHNFAAVMLLDGTRRAQSLSYSLRDSQNAAHSWQLPLRHRIQCGAAEQVAVPKRRQVFEFVSIPGMSGAPHSHARSRRAAGRTTGLPNRCGYLRRTASRPLQTCRWPARSPLSQACCIVTVDDTATAPFDDHFEHVGTHVRHH
jgi:hypothetical protein